MENRLQIWTAILLAGQRPGIDPLASAFGQSLKALVPIGGQPMVAHVAQTLLNTPRIGRIVILCQSPEAIKAVLPDDERLIYVVSQSGISESIAHVAGGVLAPWPLFVTTADHPLLTPMIIEAFLAASGESDISVGMVERAVVLAAYPDNKRTWINLKGGSWSGANLFTLSTQAAQAALTLWAGAEKDRKQLFKLFWHFGPRIAIRAVTRTISLEGGIAALGKRIGVRAKAVPIAVAEAAIDVDKLSDHALVSHIMAERKN